MFKKRRPPLQPARAIFLEEEPSASLLPPHKLLEQLIRIPSLSGEEEELTNWLVEHVKKGHFDDVYRDMSGNVIVTRGEGDRTILIIGCIDTYRGYIPVRIEHRELYGRGAVQAKGPLVAAICAVDQLKEKDVQDKTIIIAGCVNTFDKQENGISAIVNDFSPDLVIHAESTRWNGIVNGYKGSLSFYYTHSKPNAHYTANQRRTGDEAIRFIHRLSERLTALYPQRHSVEPEGQLENPHIEIHNLYTENDGLYDTTSMKLNIRYHAEFDIDTFWKFVQQQAHDATVEMSSHVPPVVIQNNTDLHELFLKSIQERGGEPRVTKRTTSSGLAFYAKQWPHIPMVVYGPGDYELERTPEERIHLDDFQRGTEILQDVLTRL